MKDQIELLNELIREVLGTISIEEFFRNHTILKMAEELLFSLNTQQT